MKILDGIIFATMGVNIFGHNLFNIKKGEVNVKRENVKRINFK